MAKDKEPEPERVLLPGKPDYDQCDNKVVTARYTLVTFFPVAILEQFRRFANLYFLIVGVIMAIGFYTDLYESALTPWTTLGPLALVITFSLLVEGSSDYKRHLNDQVTNVSPCVVLRRSDEIENDETAERDNNILKGKDVVVNINKAYYNTTSGPKNHPAHKSDVNSEGAINVHVGFEKVRRMDIHQGHFILVKNREMVPADMLLLASSNDQGSAYIETSSIDGETNLKLRNRASIPKRILKLLREGNETNLHTLTEEDDGENRNDTSDGDFETIAEAVKRITRFSYLGRPEGQSALDHPLYGEVEDAMEEERNHSRRSSRLFSSFRRNSSKEGNFSQRVSSDTRDYRPAHRIGRASVALAKSVKNFNVDLPKYAPRRLSAINDGRYISALTTEPPNPSVHTFQGKLTLPPFEHGAGCVDVPLGADNVILRGAVIRNTQWVIGVAFFTGTDTKLVQNSFDTPSKFSQLDILMNYTVAAILVLMIVIVSVMATLNQVATKDQFDDLFYIGFNKNDTEPWPYLPADFDPPEWQTTKDNWIQVFMLYITLLNQFIPLSLYITVEIVTFCMLYFINSDLDMYDNTTNTRAVARSTIVTDLGRVQYIFSDKTGTLTQNVMRFRRCSVDGIAFGAPIKKKRPGAEEEPEDDEEKSPWLPLRHLLVGQIQNDSGKRTEASNSEKLTFNAEMFIRILCLCHTVVVEKDLDKKKVISSGSSSFGGSASGGSLKERLFGRRKKESFSEDGAENSKLSKIDEEGSNTNENDQSLASTSSIGLDTREEQKGADGAPEGYAYQAESPDEGALVSAASINYGFQVRSRDSNGITIRVPKPSHFQDQNVVKGLKSGNLSMKKLAADTSAGTSSDTPQQDDYPDPSKELGQRDESWAILAVNKFDSDRKRMSILLRSPPELGSLPILFCKGADSSMLDPEVCVSSSLLNTSEDGDGGSSLDVSALTTIDDDGEDEAEGDVEANENELSCMLGMQSQLGDFASEGLRTLVLGLRILTEKECEEWLAQFNAAAVSLTDREKLLTEAGLAIEKKLHIAGATAIEDKLQVGVPDTIANLAKAGIKLWVLTGDKRETAVEIGYSTAVLTPKMSVTEVGDLGANYVRTQMAMEFMRLVKKGKLPEYQKAQLEGEGSKSAKQRWADFKFNFGKSMRSFGRMLTSCWASFLALLGAKSKAERKREILLERLEKEVKIVPENIRRGRVRDRADKVIRQWLDSNEAKKYRRPKKQKSDNELITESTPKVFQRASSARSLLGDIRSSGKLTSSDIRRISIVHRAATVETEEEDGIVDMDTLSLDSHFPGNKDDLAGNFDKKRRTLLERAFAVDRSVRKGHLEKHVHPHKLEEKVSKSVGMRASLFNPKMSDGPKALVIEGAALKHLLGDDELEEILFACAKVCDAVIACRVSPKQKAELVNLVRHNVHPTPITLAIGDGANDVGMIQEAHVGVGISGKEGTQAVNASDFAISQFRFLESLVLIHGRWDFFRLSTVVLYSFYKNAVQAGIMVIYNFRTIFSGQPVFDQWLIASLNFVCGAPIIMTGLFDRCLSKEYVKKNPEVYTASRDNEMITVRTLSRWVIMSIIHMFTLYLFVVGPSNEGGGITPAFEGLMRNKSSDRPGDGEGGDYRSVGTTMFTCLVILMAYKVLFESKSLVHGRWPAIRCSKANDSFLNRLAYTWISVSWLSVGFYFIFISAYQLVGRASSNPTVGQFADIANHVLGTRSINWMLFFFVPIFGVVFDIVFKVFSNMFYPTQTQIHMEIEAMGKRDRKRKERRAKREAAKEESPEQVSNV